MPASGRPSRRVPITRRVQDVRFRARGTPGPSTVIRIGIGGLLCKSPSALIDRNCRAFADMSITLRLRLTNLATRAPNLVGLRPAHQKGAVWTKARDRRRRGPGGRRPLLDTR